MSKQVKELDGLTSQLHKLWNDNVLPDDQLEAIGRFFNEAADNLEREMYGGSMF